MRSAGSYPGCVTYKPRDERAGFHHVVTRGNNKRTIYARDADRTFFIELLLRVAARHRWTIFAYCLMRNHYHLVIEIGDEGLSKGMCELNTAYALEFNRRHGRINHLFGKRYWSEPKPTERLMLNAVRYVLQNPLRAHRKKPLASYRWSSYRATIGLALAPSRLGTGELLAYFGTDPKKAIAHFRRFIEDTAPDDPDAREKRQPP